MSFGPTLYSNRLYGGTVYSGAAGTVMLSDTMSPADAENAQINSPMAESLVLTDFFGATATKDFSEVLSVFDTYVQNGQLQLTDFILLNEFISLRLQRASAEWTPRSGQTPGIAQSLYGQALYGRNLYSGFPAVLWKAIQLSKGPGFTNQDGHKN